MTTIDREAAPAVAVAALPALAAALAGRRTLAAVAALLPVGVALFFRDPDRTPDRAEIPADEVRSPADGKVMYAGPGQSGVAPDGDWQQVSIFLSAFDVHINRAPYGGRLTDVTYRPGKWLAAYKHESAHLNERTDLTVEREVGRRGAAGALPADRRPHGPAGRDPRRGRRGDPHGRAHRAR